MEINIAVLSIPIRQICNYHVIEYMWIGNRNFKMLAVKRVQETLAELKEKNKKTRNTSG